MMKRVLPLAAVFTLLLFGCDQQQPQLTEADPASLPQASDLQLRVNNPTATASKASSEDVSAYLAAVNEELAASGLSIAVHAAEWIAPGTADHASGKIVFANNRTKTLGSQWVPGDERGATPEGNNLTYTIYSPLAVANGSIPAEPILDAGYDAWLGQTGCSTLDIIKRPTDVLPSAIFAGGDPFVADISEVGFLPGIFFDLVLGPGASESVLGVTFGWTALVASLPTSTTTGMPTSRSRKSGTTTASRGPRRAPVASTS